MTTKKLSASSIRQHWSSFSHLEAASAFCVRGVQNSGSGAKQTEEKQKTKTNKQSKKQTGKQTISYFTILLSSYDADLSFDQNTDQRLFFLQVTVADNTNSRNNNTIGEITHDKMIISSSERVLHLVYRIYRRVCCYSNGEPPFHHSFYKEQKPSHSQNVLGHEHNCGRLVGWKCFREC